MSSRVVVAAVCGALALGCAAEATAQRAEVPIREVIISDGARRYAVTLTVGGATIETGLDTGSSGLRIMPNTLAAGDARTTGKAGGMTYSSGIKLDGHIAHADVALGGLASNIEVQVVDKVSCADTEKQCGSMKLSSDDYRIQGDGIKGQGFKAILGINMGEVDMPSPLPALGAKRWIVELPVPGSNKPGRLILNPSDEEIADYQRFKIEGQANGGLHDAIPGCLVNLKDKEKFCAPVLLDCGAPGIETINGPKGAEWPAGTDAALAFGSGGKVERSAIFQIGQRNQASRLTFTKNPQARLPQIRAGLTPYFAFTVLYDPAAHEVGLKPRADGTVKGQ